MSAELERWPGMKAVDAGLRDSKIINQTSSALNEYLSN